MSEFAAPGPLPPTPFSVPLSQLESPTALPLHRAGWGRGLTWPRRSLVPGRSAWLPALLFLASRLPSPLRVPLEACGPSDPLLRALLAGRPGFSWDTPRPGLTCPFGRCHPEGPRLGPRLPGLHLGASRPHLRPRGPWPLALGGRGSPCSARGQVAGLPASSLPLRPLWPVLTVRPLSFLCLAWLAPSWLCPCCPLWLCCPLSGCPAFAPALRPPVPPSAAPVTGQAACGPRTSFGAIPSASPWVGCREGHLGGVRRLPPAGAGLTSDPCQHRGVATGPSGPAATPDLSRRPSAQWRGVAAHSGPPCALLTLVSAARATTRDTARSC